MMKKGNNIRFSQTLFFVLLLMSLCLALYGNISTYNSSNKYILLTILFGISVFACACSIRNNKSNRKYVCWLFLNNILALTGGLVAFWINSFAGNILILISCVLNVVILCYITIKMLISYVKTKQEFIDKENLCIVLPLCFFPFFTNSIVVL